MLTTSFVRSDVHQVVARPCPKARVSRSPSLVVRAAAKDDEPKVAKFGAALAASVLVAGAAHAFTFDELQGLTYLQVKGSGIANSCPILSEGDAPDKLKAGSYEVNKLCVEPTQIKVKEESQFKTGEAEFVNTRLMTRLTYTLDEMTGKMKVGSDGSVNLEKDEAGLDFAPVTVQLPGGERVPFLFSLKGLTASGSKDNFGGDVVIPSYRGSSFLDPKGRGGSTGYDTAVALPARGDSDELLKENIKSTEALKGRVQFSIARVDPVTGEVVGTFSAIQPSDTDLGSKAPKDVQLSGIWYAQLS